MLMMPRGLPKNARNSFPYKYRYGLTDPIEVLINHKEGAAFIGITPQASEIGFDKQAGVHIMQGGIP